MNQRARKLVGTVALLLLVVFWALFAMSLAQGRLGTLPVYAQTLAYLALGLVWIAPAGALIWWMQRPDRQ
jgi:hypothetical protein